MNRNDFVNMIEDAIPVNRQMIGEVYELIDIFPYFQSAHMLLLKGLQNNADVKFENQLRNSAIHIADREVLYYLLKTKTSPEVEQGGSKQDNSGETKLDNSGETIPTEPNVTDHLSDDLLELDLDENKTNLNDEVIINMEQLDFEEKNSNKQLQSGLINKFIIANPRIEPNKEKTNLHVEDISRPFIGEEGGFVTETLAKIYINQRYYFKATEIYEKLILKFPEKSSYFASQIEKVKEYIKK